MRALASTSTSGTVLSLQKRAVFHVRVFGVVRTACLDDADERRQAVEGRLAVRGRVASVERVLRDGIPHDRRFGPTCRDREAPDFRFGLEIKANAEWHGDVLHQRRTYRMRRSIGWWAPPCPVAVPSSPWVVTVMAQLLSGFPRPQKELHSRDPLA